MDRQDFDVIVIGAGFSGLYMLYQLRALGLSVRVLEAGDGLGGTWFWNRYPGARCDIESVEYSYSFSRDLQQEWSWKEQYPSQGDVLTYLEHVADRFQLRKDIQLNTRVNSASFDEQANRWSVLAGDQRLTAKYLVSAVGCLSSPNKPNLPGLERFAGRVVHTGLWPKEGVDLAGKSVAVIGTGSSAIQLVPEVAGIAKQLTVFQRTPNFSIPSRNKGIEAQIETDVKANYGRLRHEARSNPFGVSSRATVDPRPAAAIPADEQQQILEERWAIGGLAIMGSFADLLVNPVANEIAAEFVRGKIRQTVHDPVVAEKLVPKGYPFCCKRLCLDNGYYETFNRSNVALVDLRETPLTEITPAGIRVGDRELQFDVIILATGFDAMTGALNQIDIRGKGGQSLKEKWAHGPRNYLGLAVNGFPNLFTITGPLSPSVISNMVTSIEQHVEWVAEAISYVERKHLSRIDVDAEAEAAWVDHVGMVGGYTVFAAPTCNSWYLGSNISGKKRVFTPYVGGVGAYGLKLGEVAQKGYEGFVLSR